MEEGECCTIGCTAIAVVIVGVILCLIWGSCACDVCPQRGWWAVVSIIIIGDHKDDAMKKIET